MKYPCGMIKDLLPLYVDEVAGDDSRRAVDEHLAECDSCREYLAAMKGGNALPQKSAMSDGCDNKEDEIMDEMMEKSLKKVKTRIDRKTRRMMAAAMAAVLIVLGGWQVLFNVPLKTVPLDDVRVTVGSYKLQELPYQLVTGNDEDGNGKVTVSMYDDVGDRTPTYRVEIPAMPDSQLQVTEDTMDTGGYVSAVSLESKCRLANIDWGIDGDVMYIHTLKTTLLGRHTADFAYRNDSIDFRPINKVVYLNGDTKTVLWENTQQ